MARQYSHTQFFRRVPNALLGHYFQNKHNVLEDIPFSELKETDVDPIFETFSSLPSEQQAEIEAELQDIDNMACQGGVTALTCQSTLKIGKEIQQSRRAVLRGQRELVRFLLGS